MVIYWRIIIKEHSNISCLGSSKFYSIILKDLFQCTVPVYSGCIILAHYSYVSIRKINCNSVSSEDVAHEPYVLYWKVVFCFIYKYSYT